jgi:hypothetical protein
MGKLLTLLLAIWLVGLLVCAQRIVYWNGEAEDLAIDWFNKPEDEKHWEGEEFLALQEADRKMGMWAAGAVIWGVLGAAVLIWVWRREEGRGVDAHGPTSPEQSRDEVGPPI